MINSHGLIPNTGKIWNDLDAPYAGVPLPVWVSRINPYGSDRFSALFTLSLSLFLKQIISYHCLKAEHFFKKRLPQDW
jgi:hypothetical protein